jgi:hypothetical protein
MYKVIPPRPTFAADMTETESAIISKHVAYWTDLLDKDVAVASGPVADPSGLYGMAVSKPGLGVSGGLAVAGVGPAAAPVGLR